MKYITKFFIRSVFVFPFFLICLMTSYSFKEFNINAKAGLYTFVLITLIIFSVSLYIATKLTDLIITKINQHLEKDIKYIIPCVTYNFVFFSAILVNIFATSQLGYTGWERGVNTVEKLIEKTSTKELGKASADIAASLDYAKKVGDKELIDYTKHRKMELEILVQKLK